MLISDAASWNCLPSSLSVNLTDTRVYHCVNSNVTIGYGGWDSPSNRFYTGKARPCYAKDSYLACFSPQKYTVYTAHSILIV